MITQAPTSTAFELRDRLGLLYAERALAGLVGLSDNALYADDLEDEIRSTRDAYVGTAVTEIAMLRGELSGRAQG